MKSIRALKFVLFLFLLNSASVFAFNFQAIDEAMLKACEINSPVATCKSRMAEIRKGLHPEQFLAKAPKMPIDSEIQVVIASDPKQMIADFYCLAVFNGLIPPKDFEADLFAYAVKGFSFSKKSSNPYPQWLNSQSSRKCRKELESLGLKPTIHRFEKSFVVVLNPVSFLENGSEDNFYTDGVMAYNHERLHAVFSHEKAESKVLGLWKSLVLGQQDQFKREHSRYNFENKSILAKEFFSYTFERSPTKAYDFLSGKLPLNKTNELGLELCDFCVREDDSVLRMVEDLAALSPSDLIKQIENKGIKVLILSPGRKNPSPLFNWGSIRIDKGELNQITKIEGAMGKTLCRGEKPEAQDGTTIILAADSPYSTLIHEYLHVLQIQRDHMWCPLSKQLWGKKTLLPGETRMVRDREWDVRVALWKLFKKSKNMNIEDELIIADGITNEGELRKSFDPSAIKFIQTNHIQEFKEMKSREYMNSIKN